VRRAPRPDPGRAVLSRLRVAAVSVPDAGHALPVLGVAAALRRRGAAVTVWTDDAHRGTAALHDVTWRALPTARIDDGGDLGRRLWDGAVATAPALAAGIAASGADVVVADTLTRVGALAAAACGLPWVEVVPHHLADPDDDLPPVGLGRAPARTPWRRADDRRLVAAQRRSVELGRRQASAAAARLGLVAAPPGARLLATLPGLERRRRHWPADAHVVGPLALDPAGPPLAAPDGDAPLVLVTDSTARSLERSLGEVALRALRHLDLRLVVTTSRLPPSRRPGVVVGTGPHGPLLAQAAVAVTPGGGGSLTKAAAAAVPVVVVPLHGDQREAAARARDAGVARVLPPGRLTPRRLRWAVVRHLADRRAAGAAARLADQAATLGPDRAAAIVEQVAVGRPPRAAAPHGVT
jgi:UDP:flavonoid glycosyltransferase YjiC (YdhE family)